MDDCLGAVKAVSFTLSALLVSLVLWCARGYLVTEGAAQDVLTYHGLGHGKLTKTHVWFTAFTGCRGEAAQFEGIVITRTGKSPVVVCVSWPWDDGWAYVRR